MLKKLFSLALALAMVLTLLPAVQLTANAAELPKLAAPTDLTLGYKLEWQYNETTQVAEKEPMPGSMVFKTAYPHQEVYEYNLYRVGESSPIYEFSFEERVYKVGEEPEWVENRYLAREFEYLGAGTYYVMMVAKGDGINYADSDPVKSAEWTYVVPQAKLDKCTNPAWDGTKITWNQPENALGYEIEVSYAPAEDAEPDGWHSISTYYHEESGKAEVDMNDLPWIFQQFGVGYYYFKVRALSPDISKWQSSDWSELSEPYYLDTAPVNKELDEILAAEDKTPDDVLEAVQEMDNYALKEALLADQQVADNIALLEEKVGGAATVEVSQEAAAFNGEEVSIVGANLNKSSADAQDVKLVIDKPEKEHILPTQYNNAVAVKFSMDLENVQDTENLAVPVKITLPVPANINPRFLVVLHYHADGTMEEVWPYIETNAEGKTYASFVLTSFSDFVMTERAAFTDVPEDAFYFEPVRWAVDWGITNGTSDTTFTPNGICTRAQVVTFLWRACGCQKPTSADNPFTDVPAGQWYTDAVLWAVEQGITTGTSATTFSPNDGCTRGQVATFLWRLFDEPQPSASNIFTDIASGAYYYNPVLWAVENGITNGMGDGTFAPDATCNRGQIVTFLYRAMVG